MNLTTAEWAFVTIALRDYQVKVERQSGPPAIVAEVAALRLRFKTAGAREWTAVEKEQAAHARRQSKLVRSAS